MPKSHADANRPMGASEICERAVKLGAADARPISARGVVVRDWVRLKCQFGCGGFGQCLTCPPYSPTPEKTRRVLSEYSQAILVRFEPSGPDTHKTMVKLEREAFLSGHYAAFAIAAGPCEICAKCNLERCTHPREARPSMESCGIDVYATVRKAGMPIQVVKTHKETPRYYGLLLVR
jgi:predicted metal-binding protein